ncbi:DUF4157 domain-containing protein [Nostoc sp. C052]|uniref:eCIS core domain-containing protein n=1 Tax=Nostoc sp. C052 TaxID=2576902 RepID=UPI001C4CA684|nr:DUF4157 domain-containing protein [Nostoc sp. C052]
MSSKTQAPVNATTKPSLSADKSGLLQRKCACGKSAGLTGECATCQKEKLTLQRKQTATQDDVSEVPPIAHEILPLPRVPMMQTKLTIGASNDPLEQEADRIADQVLAAPAHPAVSVAPPRIQRFTGQPTGQTDVAAPASVDRVLSSPGSPLEPALQQDMEQRFGYDFSRVRIHTDAAAVRSAQDVNANAYTVGHNIVFGIDQYSPETHEGQSLIAHELTHVLQQSQGSSIATIFLQRDPNDNQLTPKDRQLACVVRRGGCSSGTYSRDGGTADEDIPKYNKICRDEEKTNYDGSDIKPTPDECNNPPKEPLPAGAKILLGAFLVVGSGLAIAAVAVTAEAIIPIVIASIVETGTTGYAFYLANAFAVNEIGLFTAGLLMSCEGNVLGLLHAITTDPEQAIKILAEVYILHTSISVNNGSPRSATVPVKLLPPSEQQANSEKIRFKTVGPPHFEDTKPPEPITPPARQLTQGQNPPITPPARQLTQGQNPPITPPARQLTQGQNPPITPPARQLTQGQNPPITPPARQLTQSTYTGTGAGEVLGEIPPSDLPKTLAPNLKPGDPGAYKGIKPYFGSMVQQPAAKILQRRFSSSKLNFDNIEPSKNGPDVVWEGGKDPGFDLADLKAGEGEFNKFTKQAQSWVELRGKPLRVAMIVIAENGAVYTYYIGTFSP